MSERICIPVDVRFWAKVDKVSSPSGCWLWTASTNDQGYGKIHTSSGLMYAHRWAYEDAFGPIPTGLKIDHVRARGCVNHNCVNPAHLEPVTQRENLMRGDTVAARNAAKTHCLRGHPYTEANTYRGRSGQRRCATCHNEQRRKKRLDG